MGAKVFLVKDEQGLEFFFQNDIYSNRADEIIEITYETQYTTMMLNSGEMVLLIREVHEGTESDSEIRGLLNLTEEVWVIPMRREEPHA